MLTKRWPPFGPRIWTLFWTPFWTPFWTSKFFWTKKNMTVHAKTSINAVRTPICNAFVSPGNAGECTKVWTSTQANTPPVALRFCQTHLRFFSNTPSFFSQLVHYKCRLERTFVFIRTFLTFGKNRSLLLTEQEVGPNRANSFIADLEVVTNVRDITW